MITSQSVFLVVDDSKTMRHVTSAQLRSIGVEQIITANDGAEAFGLLQTRHVDLVLSDWNMPVMSGLELLKAVRSDERLFALPFVMVTAEAEREREHVEEAIACGVSGLLVKPYTTERLAYRIEKALAWMPRRIAPAATPQPTVGSLPAPSAGGTSRPTILVVDDSADNLLLNSRLFADEYRTLIADSGQRALEICCSDSPPDLVLLDIMMPGMDGFEVAARMRQHPLAENIPVIFVTALTSDDACLKGLELGAVEFVSKPVDPRILQLRVRNFMRYVELRKQVQAGYDLMLEAARLREDLENITRNGLKPPRSEAGVP